MGQRFRAAWSATAAATAVVVLGACGVGQDVASRGVGAEAAPVRDLVGYRGVNSIANAADAGVVGEVVEVGAPVTFQQVIATDPGYPSETAQRTTRDVVIEVREVKFAGPGVPVAPGQRLTVVMKHLDQKGETVTTRCGAAIGASARNGEFSPGAVVFALVQFVPTGPGPNGPRHNYWMLAWGWQSVWTIEGAQARSVDPNRNAAVAALVERLLHEREPMNRGEPSPDRPGGFRGRPERDPGTEDNPLAPASTAPTDPQRCPARPAPSAAP